MEIVELHTEFDERSAHVVCEAILKALEKGEDITISIDSNGGYVTALEEIIATMDYARSKGIKVNTHNRKKAFSCGVMLLSYGDERSMHPTATAMLHTVGIGSMRGGKVEDLEDRVRKLREFNDEWFSWLAKNLKISKKTLRKRTFNTDWFMGTKEATKIGLIDKTKVL